MENENKEQKIFTQEEVNAIVKERLERERARYNSDADTLATLQSEVAKLRADLEKANKEAVEKEEAYKAEKINAGVTNVLTSANLLAPNQMARMFVTDVTMKEDGRITIEHEGEEMLFADYINKVWGKQNLWAIRDTQKPGAGEIGKPVGGNENVDSLREVFVRKG